MKEEDVHTSFQARCGKLPHSNSRKEATHHSDNWWTVQVITGRKPLTTVTKLMDCAWNDLCISDLMGETSHAQHYQGCMVVCGCSPSQHESKAGPVLRY